MEDDSRPRRSREKTAENTDESSLDVNAIEINRKWSIKDGGHWTVSA